MDIEEVLLDTEDRMDKSVQHFRSQLAKVRTGKASTALLEDITINLYGTEMPLTQCSNLMTPEARLIIVQPYDKNAIPTIEKAIMVANIGLNPVNDGTVIRISVPALTEERRRDLVKVVHKFAEDARQSVRQIRRDANDSIKKLEKASEISEDNMHDHLAEVQTFTDDHVKEIDKMMQKKEEEILEI